MKPSIVRRIDIESTNSMRAPSFIDLFAGCGGLSLGLLNAGWKGIFAVEKSDDAFETFKHNLLNNSAVSKFDWPVWLPKKKMSVETLLKKKKEMLGLGSQIDLVAGGPPCQGFSMAGMRKSNDPRNALVHRFFDVVQYIKPRFVVMENVEGIRRPFRKGKKNGKTLATSERLEQKFSNLGYVHKWITLQADSFGVPQSRSRSFLFAISKTLISKNHDFKPELYIEISRKKFLKSKRLPITKPISVKQAISDLQIQSECDGKEREKIPCVDSPSFYQVLYDGPRTLFQSVLRKGMKPSIAPNSMRLVKHNEATRSRFKTLQAEYYGGNDLSDVLLTEYNIKKHSFSILDPNKPAPTITSIPDDFIHYCEPRVLTVRELARIQSFPDWFDFLGKYTTGGKRRRKEVPRYTQVANAVPPFIAEVIGMALKDFYTNVTNGNS